MKKQKRMHRFMEDRKYGNGKTTGCPTKAFGHDRQCGFTLVELVIVIAIVIILSVISVPIYRGYVDKAKYAEGYALIGTIVSAQKAYYSEYGNFLKNENGSYQAGKKTAYEKVLGIDARGNKYFTLFDTGTNYPTDDFWLYVEKPKELQEANGYRDLCANYSVNGGLGKINETNY